MTIYLVSIIYWFLQIMEIALFVYILVSWIPFAPAFRNVMAYIMDPILAPIRKLVRKSVVYMQGLDLAPIILYLLIAYGKQICLVLR